MDGTSAFNTRMVGEDVSSFLVQQGEGEVDRDPAAQRRGGDGVAVLRQGFAKHLIGGGEVLGRGGAAPWMWCAALPSPLYL